MNMLGTHSRTGEFHGELLYSEQWFLTEGYTLVFLPSCQTFILKIMAGCYTKFRNMKIEKFVYDKPVVTDQTHTQTHTSYHYVRRVAGLITDQTPSHFTQGILVALFKCMKYHLHAFSSPAKGVSPSEGFIARLRESVGEKKTDCHLAMFDRCTTLPCGTDTPFFFSLPWTSPSSWSWDVHTAQRQRVSENQNRSI